MRLLLLLTTLLSFAFLNAQEINIIPKPRLVEIKQGNFLITPTTVIVLGDGSEKESASFFNQHLRTYYGFQLKIVKTSTKNFIRFSTKKFIQPGTEGKYDLNVNISSIEISGDTYSGTFNGMQTLLQLLPTANFNSSLRIYKLSIPQLSIQDEPRFQYRGMHLDIGRHYQPIAFIKRYIDFLAYHKLNKFHWHLTEDQGWRIEIKQYPELTTVGSKRNGTIIGRYPGKGNDNKPHEGYYTQAQIKEVVQYAKERFVEVIPEIEMPGHSSAAIAAYPWLSCFPEKPTAIPANMISAKSIEEQKNGRIKLVQETWGVFDDVFCAGNDSVFAFLQNVIDEVIALFPSKYFHIGGDECPKTHWKQCPRCQQRMKDLGLKDEHELQSWFVQRIEKYLNSKGKTLIGWDEILEGGLAPNAIVMSWRGEAGGIEAAKQKHQVIMTPGKPVYFDHTQSKNEDSVTIGGYNPVEAVYAYDPVPKELNEEEGKYVLGAQANVWTEYMNNTKKIEYMIFPRMAALSEVLWSTKENKSWEDFEKRLPVHMKQYEMMGLNYSKAYYDLEGKVSAESSKIIWSIKSKVQGTEVIVRKMNSESDSILGYLPYYTSTINSFEIPQSGKYVALLTKSHPTQKKSLIIGTPIFQTFTFSKSTGQKITLTNPPSNSYPGDGAFTLVNGIINEKGRERAHEILGFSGTDCEAVIDLGKEDTISNVTAHIFSQPSSWIWPPSSFTVQTSADGINFNAIVDVGPPVLNENKVQLNFAVQITRFVKVFIKNKGIIPEGHPGAGNKAWLFVSEVQVNSPHP
ncbi:beta-N-acetylhexosaminidase [Lacibacter sp. MH-610]|uniref:beta-N-acetylhexosaminidase n=1 Tax=Lacibacter sp. MH-610 TaxID=3020883 RepID=UPI0038929A26